MGGFFKVSTIEKAWNRIFQFKGGQLKQHAEFWKTLTSDPEILKLVHGVLLDFTIQPAMVNGIAFNTEKRRQ